jgi:hypothetical protein
MGPSTNHDTLVMGQEAVRRGGEQGEQYPGTYGVVKRGMDANQGLAASVGAATSKKNK